MRSFAPTSSTPPARSTRCRAVAGPPAHARTSESAAAVAALGGGGREGARAALFAEAIVEVVTFATGRGGAEREALEFAELAVEEFLPLHIVYQNTILLKY